MTYVTVEIALEDADTVEVERLATERGDWQVYLADTRKQTNLRLNLTDDGAQWLLAELLDRFGDIPEARQFPRIRAALDLAPLPGAGV